MSNLKEIYRKLSLICNYLLKLSFLEWVNRSWPSNGSSPPLQRLKKINNQTKMTLLQWYCLFSSSVVHNNALCSVQKREKALISLFMGSLVFDFMFYCYIKLTNKHILLIHKFTEDWRCNGYRVSTQKLRFVLIKFES